MDRRAFIGLVGAGTVTLPFRARAQPAALPVVGYLHPGVPTGRNVPAFHRGLGEAGFVEGRNVRVEYRWAEGRFDRLPELAADLVRRRVEVIATPGDTNAALAAKAATATIPIVFGVSEDPVGQGLVASLARPGGNATGVNFSTSELVAKRLGLLRELLPQAVRIALLVNPANVANTRSTLREVEAAAPGLSLQVRVLEARTAAEIDAAFAAIARDRLDAAFVAPDSYFASRREQLTGLAARHGIPAVYAARLYVDAGGLLSYGPDIAAMVQRVGEYVGRILNGKRPADLPVEQVSKFELVINLAAAKALGLAIPQPLLLRADDAVR